MDKCDWQVPALLFIICVLQPGIAASEAWRYLLNKKEQ